MSVPTVYLAGPMVFEPDPAATFDAMKAICSDHGMEGVSPLDNQLGLERRKPGRALVRAIVSADMELMQSLDAGLFCLDSFRRSAEMDPGTAFEIGYMCALGKPMAGWTRDIRPYPARVAGFFQASFGLDLQPAPGTGTGATSGALRDPDGILVHSEGCYQNAMTQVGIEMDGGRVFAHADWRHAFAQAAAHLAGRLGAHRARPARARRPALA